MLLPSINLSDPTIVCDTLRAGAQALRSYDGCRGCSHHIPSVGQILISGDLHDNPLHLAKVIKLASLEIPDNHVVLQELIHSVSNPDGIDLSYRMLVRVAALVLAFPKQVHPILANHELSQATNRSITKGRGDLVEMFNLGLDHVFNQNAHDVTRAVCEFIYAMPIAVRSESGLLCSHSLPSESAMDNFDVTLLDRELCAMDLQGTSGSAYNMVWGRDHSQEQVSTLGMCWGATLFCLGHALVPSGIEVALPNMLQLNSDHNNGVALPLELDSIPDAHGAIELAIKLASVSVTPHEL